MDGGQAGREKDGGRADKCRPYSMLTIVASHASCWLAIVAGREHNRPVWYVLPYRSPY